MSAVGGILFQLADEGNLQIFLSRMVSNIMLKLFESGAAPDGGKSKSCMIADLKPRCVSLSVRQICWY